MQKLMLRDDVRILYFDTDSILYQYDTQKGDPMEDGKHLGEMTGKTLFNCILLKIINNYRSVPRIPYSGVYLHCAQGLLPEADAQGDRRNQL
jgi:hypothetical protein